jgi:DNA-binding transcriptional MerR regulator
MLPFQLRFQIRDLEEFSGVKAHTIRMWEKRYGLLSPERTDTNIRTYGVDELKAILNVAYLNRHGYKISKIAKLPVMDRDRLVREVATRDDQGEGVINGLQMAMLGFDEALFRSVTVKFRLAHGFPALVERIYVPLLERIGVLWQTSSICPAHEHFVSNLIRQDLIAATEALTVPTREDSPIHVLFLAENELHELGLLYVNHLLRTEGQRTIYLGQSVPREDLVQVAGLFSKQLVFVTILMAYPLAPELPDYLTQLRNDLPGERITFRIAGSQLKKLPDYKAPEGMRTYVSMADLLADLRTA